MAIRNFLQSMNPVAGGIAQGFNAVRNANLTTSPNTPIGWLRSNGNNLLRGSGNPLISGGANVSNLLRTNPLQYNPTPYTSSSTQNQLSPSSQAFNAQVRNLAPGQLLPGEGGTQPTSIQQTVTGGGAPQVNPSPILSSTGVRQEYENASAQLNELAVEEDPYMGIFQQMMENNARAEKNQIASATAASANTKNALTDSREEYMAQLRKEGVNTGANRYTRSQHAGVLESARRSYLSRYQQIDNEEKLAIAEANAARANGDVRIMTEKLDYIQGLRKAKADAIAEANKLAWEQEKFNRQMEQEDAQFERNMSYKWANLARLSKDDEEDAEDEIFPQILALKQKKRDRLSREGVTQEAINFIAQALNSGEADIDEILADLPLELQPEGLTPRAVKVIKEGVQ